MANVFPKWSNIVPIKVVIALFLTVSAATAGVWYYCSPNYTKVGYMPTQPVPYSHALHVGQLGLDCRMCHTFVDRSAHANIPGPSVCMNCHSPDLGNILGDSPRLAPIRDSYASGQPVPWIKIHNEPDYVFFNHAVHVNRGVSCVECHGQINQMDTVAEAKPLGMAFCLNCHRNPEQVVRPLDKVFDLTWKADNAQAQSDDGTKFVHDWKILPPQSCSGCHR
jgi:formate-dependent nitrite reductase cytochrome c552 subunit